MPAAAWIGQRLGRFAAEIVRGTGSCRPPSRRPLRRVFGTTAVAQAGLAGPASEEPSAAGGIPGHHSRAGFAAAERNQLPAVGAEVNTAEATCHGVSCGSTRPVATLNQRDTGIRASRGFRLDGQQPAIGAGRSSTPTGSGNASRATRPVLVSQRVTLPTAPSVVSVRPSGRKETALATRPSRAGRTLTSRCVRRLRVPSEPSSRGVRQKGGLPVDDVARTRGAIAASALAPAEHAGPGPPSPVTSNAARLPSWVPEDRGRATGSSAKTERWPWLPDVALGDRAGRRRPRRARRRTRRPRSSSRRE